MPYYLPLASPPPSFSTHTHTHLSAVEMFGLALSVSLLTSQAWAAFGPVANMSIVNKVIAPDGYSRDTVLVNGQFPGPLLTAKKGDNFSINVYNSLHDTSMETVTTIHWHGIHQNHTNYQDGTEGVTQCPIIPNNTYQYNFQSLNQAGTFWYHSHVGTQYCDGLRGPLVIYDPHDPYKHLYDIDDESTVITLSDWYHTPALEAGYGPNQDSNLINGKGRYWGGPQEALSVINVKQGKRYRIRLLAIVCHPNYVFSIDGHNFTIIEADGVNTEPLGPLDSLKIFPAQRYSFILHANQPVGNYWIRALPNSGNQTTEGGLNSAILRYHGAPDEEPTTVNTTSVAPLNETNLHALTNPAAPGLPFPGGADYNLNIELSYNSNYSGSGMPRFELNGYTFEPTKHWDTPVLLQILSGARAAQEMLPAGSVYTLPPNVSVEVSFSSAGNTHGFPHPFHLHGHHFSVVRSSGSSTYNYVNPVQRDTVDVGGKYANDNTTIRFFTDNTGPWLLHCHIEWHLVLGMAVVFAENPSGAPSYSPVTESWESLCPAYDDYQSSLNAMNYTYRV